MTRLKIRYSAPEIDPRGHLALVPRVRALARCLCGDRRTADTLAKAALLRDWRDLSPPGPAQAREMRVFAIVCDLFQSMAPSPWPSPPSGNRALAGAGVMTGQDARGDDRRGLERALARLPFQQRLALALVDGALRSHAEAAALCGCAPGTIASRVNRGRRRLSMILAEHATPSLQTERGSG